MQFWGQEAKLDVPEHSGSVVGRAVVENEACLAVLLAEPFPQPLCKNLSTSKHSGQTHIEVSFSL